MDVCDDDEQEQCRIEFVWQRWRSEWYMATIVAHKMDEHTQQRLIKVHVHGEQEAADKWFPFPSVKCPPAIVCVVPIADAVTAIGVFPAVGDYVQLLLIDHELVLSLPQLSALVGTVVRVRPDHDTAVVDVLYPNAQVRRIHISNGYIKIISASAFEAAKQQLLDTIN